MECLDTRLALPPRYVQDIYNTNLNNIFSRIMVSKHAGFILFFSSRCTPHVARFSEGNWEPNTKTLPLSKHYVAVLNVSLCLVTVMMK